jgi:hypothetical protein
MLNNQRTQWATRGRFIIGPPWLPTLNKSWRCSRNLEEVPGLSSYSMGYVEPICPCGLWLPTNLGDVQGSLILRSFLDSHLTQWATSSRFVVGPSWLPTNLGDAQGTLIWRSFLDSHHTQRATWSQFIIWTSVATNNNHEEMFRVLSSKRHSTWTLMANF